jgi:ACS family hexuronate transporter-like MFS transporter
MNRVVIWVPAFTMMLMSLISYIDRNTLAILAPTICKDVGMSDEDYGWVITSFSIAYMVGNPVWGWLLDRFGLRAGMTAAVAFWTVASAAHAFADSFWEFAIARALLGFGEGATFPGGLRAVMQTLPPLHRARGVAIAYSGGSLGAIVAPLIVTPIHAQWGWQKAFLFTGLIGVAWVILWQIVALRQDIRTVSDERQDLAGEASAGQTEALVTHRPRAGDSRMWAFMAAYALGGAPLGFILYWSAKYLNQTFGTTQIDLGKLLWIPPLGWEVGYFFWGWMVDRALRRRSAVAVELRMMMLLTLLSLPLAVVPFCTSLWEVMLLKFLAMVVAAGFIIVALSYATRIFARSSSGLIAGLGAGAWSACVATFSPLFGHLFDTRQFALAFLGAAILPVLGFLLWLRFRNPRIQTG